MGRKSELISLFNVGPRERNHHDYTQLLDDTSRWRNSEQNTATEDMDIEKKKKKEDSDEFPSKKIPYPKQIFFIISMEACERFSYYGMNTILTIYLIHLFERVYSRERAEDVSSTIYHVYKFGCYASALIGAALADSFVGKYRTILYIGILYAIGQGILAFGAVGNGPEGIEGFPNMPVSFIGIFLICFGTGGIKPCVVSLGADQFKVPEQVKQMASYFAMFYASINFGSMISTVVTPLIRRIECLGEESCYSLAFGVPAILMALALLSFFVGSRYYKKIIPERNIVTLFFSCSWYALTRRKYKKKNQHWLDVAVDRYDQDTINDFKPVYSVGKLFLLYPMYWALYDQQGSRWTIQAMRMDGYTFGFQILPDQMQVANPILILTLIPLFDYVIYPLLGKFGVLKTPLQRIVTGCFLCGLAFVASGVLELELKKGYPELPKDGQTKFYLHNGVDCTLSVEATNQNAGWGNIEGHQTLTQILDRNPFTLSVRTTSGSCGNNLLNIPVNLDKKSKTVLIYQDASGQLASHVSVHEDHITKDNNDPMPFTRIISGLKKSCRASSLNWMMRRTDKPSEGYNVDLNSTVGDSPSVQLESTKEHNVTVVCSEPTNPWLISSSHTFKVGASYNIFLTGDDDNFSMTPDMIVEDNKVHIMWLLPQYTIVTVGEILFSITSMEFAYSQAPPSMKSVLQSLYLMTTAVGNLITMAIIEIFSAFDLPQYAEFFTFAGLMTVFSFILMFVAFTYEYNYYTEDKKEERGGNEGYRDIDQKDEDTN